MISPSRVAALAVAVVVAAGCTGGAGPEDTTATTATTGPSGTTSTAPAPSTTTTIPVATTTTATPATVPTTTAPNPHVAAVAGEWRLRSGGFEYRVVFRESGQLLVVNTAPGSPAQSGTWDITADTLTLRLLFTGWACPAGEGTYAWSVSGDSLTVTVIEDGCRVREEFFSGGLRRA